MGFYFNNFLFYFFLHKSKVTHTPFLECLACLLVLLDMLKMVNRVFLREICAQIGTSFFNFKRINELLAFTPSIYYFIQIYSITLYLLQEVVTYLQMTFA